MLWCDIRRSVLSRRMLFTIMFGLFCLYQPTFYIMRTSGRWIWENGLIASLQDAYGFGVYIFCAPATASMCASALYVQDKSTGVYPFIVERIGRKRYLLSKLLCCGLSGSVALVLPVLIFSFLQFSLYAQWQCKQGEWGAIWLDAATFVPFGFVWSIIGLALSTCSDSTQVAYASPYAIAMILKMLSSRLGWKWMDPMRQISPLNTTLLAPWLIAAIQGAELLICLLLLWKGVRKCAE